MTIVIDNFSVGVEEWVPVSTFSAFSVDVVDTTYGINVFGTYFLHDGVAVSTAFSGIPDGYRCYYSPVSVYASGTITLELRAANLNSDTLSEYYHLLYGYHCEFNELVDWGTNQMVVTTVQASNLVTCPNTEGFATYFQTADYLHKNLGAYIKPIEAANLGATIYPQNTFFFYGRTYKIRIENVKDFSGNTMPVYEFEFTIEDPN
jgi:hypothetical protein